MKERHDQTRIRPRKKVQEDLETERSWGVKESGESRDHSSESAWCVGDGTAGCGLSLDT